MGRGAGGCVVAKWVPDKREALSGMTISPHFRISGGRRSLPRLAPRKGPQETPACARDTVLEDEDHALLLRHPRRAASGGPSRNGATKHVTRNCGDHVPTIPPPPYRTDPRWTPRWPMAIGGDDRFAGIEVCALPPQAPAQAGGYSDVRAKIHEDSLIPASDVGGHDGRSSRLAEGGHVWMWILRSAKDEKKYHYSNRGWAIQRFGKADHAHACRPQAPNNSQEVSQGTLI